MKYHVFIITLLAVNSCGHSNSPTSTTTSADTNVSTAEPIVKSTARDTGSIAIVASDSGANEAVTADTVGLPTPDCHKQLLTTIEGFKVWKLNSGDVVFKAKMAIDADGSPRAYCPDNKGLDWTANAGKPGNWWAVVTDASGKPVIQGPNDPVPGCYVSTTSLMKAGGAKSNPLKLLTAGEIATIGKKKLDLLGGPAIISCLDL